MHRALAHEGGRPSTDYLVVAHVVLVLLFQFNNFLLASQFLLLPLCLKLQLLLLLLLLLILPARRTGEKTPRKHGRPPTLRFRASLGLRFLGDFGRPRRAVHGTAPGFSLVP